MPNSPRICYKVDPDIRFIGIQFVFVSVAL